MPRKKTKVAKHVGTEPTIGTAASRATTTRKHLRGKLGGLKDMPTMPMDILVEASSFFSPESFHARGSGQGRR